MDESKDITILYEIFMTPHMFTFLVCLEYADPPSFTKIYQDLRRVEFWHFLQDLVKTIDLEYIKVVFAIC